MTAEFMKMKKRNDNDDIDLNFFYNELKPLDIEELSLLIEKIDKILINPIKYRDYFVSFNEIAEKFLNHGNIIYCRDKIGNLIGLVVFYADRKNYELAYETYIGVLKKYQGYGIAKELMKREIEKCKQLGMKGLLTSSHKDNYKKIKLNIKIGFSKITDKNEINQLLERSSKWSGSVFFKIIF